VGTLEFGQDPQHAEQEAEIPGHRRLKQDCRFDHFFDFRAEKVNDQPVFGDCFAVIAREGQSGAGQIGRYQVEQLDDLCIDIIKITLKCLPQLGHSQTLPGPFASGRGLESIATGQQCSQELCYCETVKNITVSVPDDVYRSARIVAAQRDTSVSALVVAFLEQLSGRMDEFARLEALQHEIQAGIGQFRAAGRLSRDEVHDRAVR